MKGDWIVSQAISAVHSPTTLRQFAQLIKQAVGDECARYQAELLSLQSRNHSTGDKRRRSASTPLSMVIPRLFMVC